MNYKINKFLTIGLISCSIQFVDSSENNNIILNNSNVNNNVVTNNIQMQNNNIRDDYSIPIDVNTPLTKEEIKEFFENLKNSPSALVNAQRQIYSLWKVYYESEGGDCSELSKNLADSLYDYFHEVANSKTSDLTIYYSNGMNSIISDNNFQLVAIISEYLNNIVSQDKKYVYIPDRENVLDDAYIIYTNVITKIVRGVNFIENFIKTKQKSIYNKKKQTTDTEEKDITNFDLSSYLTDKRKKNNNKVLTLYNGNGKCCFTSIFQVFATAVYQSDSKDPIRKTNFAKFVMHLQNMQHEFDREVDGTKSIAEMIKQFKKLRIVTGSKNQIHNLTIDKIYQNNVKGVRIDLFTELINWCSKDENWYNKKMQLTNNEKTRRAYALKLIEGLQDIYYGTYTANALAIIMNLFPELKNFFGNFIYTNEDGSFDDSIINYINNTSINNDEIKSNVIKETNEKYNDMYTLQMKLLQKSNQISNINEQKFYRAQLRAVSNLMQNHVYNDQKYKWFGELQLQSFNDFYPYVITHENASSVLSVNEKLSCNNTDYLIFNAPFETSGYSINNTVEGYKYITIYNSNMQLEVYELVGMQLGNSSHSICFIKTDKSDSSWSGVDSGADANHDNYTLEDIMYNEELDKIRLSELINQNALHKNVRDITISDLNLTSLQSNNKIRQTKLFDIINITNQKILNKKTNEVNIGNLNSAILHINQNKNNIKDSNTFLAKQYKYYNYRPGILLYKKVHQNEVALIEFKKWAYKILRDECTDYIMEANQNDNNVIYAYGQILSAISSEKNNVRMYRLLNDKNYNKKVNNIIRNNIKKIKEENNNKILNNNKKA